MGSVLSTLFLVFTFLSSSVTGRAYVAGAIPLVPLMTVYYQSVDAEEYEVVVVETNDYSSEY